MNASDDCDKFKNDPQYQKDCLVDPDAPLYSPIGLLVGAVFAARGAC